MRTAKDTKSAKSLDFSPESNCGLGLEMGVFLQQLKMISPGFLGVLGALGGSPFQFEYLLATISVY